MGKRRFISWKKTNRLCDDSFCIRRVEQKLTGFLSEVKIYVHFYFFKIKASTVKFTIDINCYPKKCCFFIASVLSFSSIWPQISQRDVWICVCQTPLTSTVSLPGERDWRDSPHMTSTGTSVLNCVCEEIIPTICLPLSVFQSASE